MTYIIACRTLQHQVPRINLFEKKDHEGLFRKEKEVVNYKEITISAARHAIKKKVLQNKPKAKNSNVLFNS